MDNLIRTLIYSRIKALLAQSDGLTSVPHNLTKGQLRERLLLDFLSGILPNRYTLCSGFVTDSYGHSTPQLDLIIAELLDVPRLVLDKEVSLVPVESFRAIVEIKTTVEIPKLSDQFNRQFDAFKDFTPSYFSAFPSPFNARAYIIGFDAQRDQLRSYMEQNEQIRGCCIVGKYALVRHEMFFNQEQIVILEDQEQEARFEGTVTFIGCLFRDLETVTFTHSPHYQLASMFWQHENTRPLAHALHGKRWFWERYVSETLAQAAEEWQARAQESK